MGALVGIVAGLIALLGLLVALGNAGYLAMLSSAARKRGISGESTAVFVKERRGTAVGTTAVAAIGLLLTLGARCPSTCSARSSPRVAAWPRSGRWTARGTGSAASSDPRGVRT